MPLQLQIECSVPMLSALSGCDTQQSSVARRGGKRDGCVISLKGNLCFLHADSLTSVCTSVCLFDLRGSLAKFGMHYKACSEHGVRPG